MKRFSPMGWKPINQGNINMNEYIYETEEEAKEAVKRIYEQDPHEFCPLINGICNPKCKCIVPPYHRGNGAYSSKDLRWKAEGWGCDCYSLVGPL